MAVRKKITARTLKAILCFVASNETPSLEFRDIPKSLIKKIKAAIGENDGDLSVILCFAKNETELLQEFNELCETLARHFNVIDISTFIEAQLLEGVLCFIDPTMTPKIAFDDNSLAVPLIEKVKSIVGNKSGSVYVNIEFSHEEYPLLRQLNGVCKIIADEFQSAADYVLL